MHQVHRKAGNGDRCIACIVKKIPTRRLPQLEPTDYEWQMSTRWYRPTKHHFDACG